MNTKEAVEKMRGLNEILCEETISDIVSALKRGEKYEAMWKKLGSDIAFHNPEWRDEIWDMMEFIEQKYFPKDKEAETNDETKVD